MANIFQKINKTLWQLVLSVPVRWKIIGIGILPVIILGVTLNYWITSGLSDWLSYILTDVRVEAAMSAGSRSVMFVTGLAAFLSIILLALLVHILNTPIDSLKKTAEEVAAGNYGSRAAIWARDEIGMLAAAINQMIDNFVSIQEDLSKTNRHLAAINQISLAADQESEIHDVLFLALESMLDLLGLEFGWVYLYDPEIDKHHLASWKNIPEQLQPILLNAAPENLCETQKKLVTKRLENRIGVETCTHLLKAGYNHHQARHITIPIVAREMQFGLINLYCPDSSIFDRQTTELLESIGTKVSEVVANAWLKAKLHEKEAARQFLLESLVTAQEDERSHLARELHDQAGQSLTGLLIRLKDLENGCDQEDQKDKLLDMQMLVSETINQIRDLSYSLRPPALEEFGLGAAINSLAEEISVQTGLRITFKNRIESKLPKNLETVLYRIVQEGLTNVSRHAKASHVIIELEPRENQIYLKIQDNGQGFIPAEIVSADGQRHLGLISMHERADLIGGRFHMFSEPGVGTTIEVHVPYQDWEMLND